MMECQFGRDTHSSRKQKISARAKTVNVTACTLYSKLGGSSTSTVGWALGNRGVPMGGRSPDNLCRSYVQMCILWRISNIYALYIFIPNVHLHSRRISLRGHWAADTRNSGWAWPTASSSFKPLLFVTCLWLVFGIYRTAYAMVTPYAVSCRRFVGRAMRLSVCLSVCTSQFDILSKRLLHAKSIRPTRYTRWLYF